MGKMRSERKVYRLALGLNWVAEWAVSHNCTNETLVESLFPRWLSSAREGRAVL